MIKWVGILIILASILTATVQAFEVNERSSTVASSLEPSISIVTPEEGNLYVMGAQIIWLPFGWTVIMGPITIRAEVTGVENPTVNFYIDDELKMTDTIPPFEYPWWNLCFGFHVIKAEIAGQNVTDSVNVFKVF